MKTTNKTTKTTKNTMTDTELIYTQTEKKYIDTPTNNLTDEDRAEIRKANTASKQDALKAIITNNKQDALRNYFNNPLAYTYNIIKTAKDGNITTGARNITMYDILTAYNDIISNDILKLNVILYNFYANNAQDLSAKGNMNRKDSVFVNLQKKVLTKDAKKFFESHKDYKDYGKKAIAAQLTLLINDILGNDFVTKFLNKDVNAILASLTGFKGGAATVKGVSTLCNAIEQVIIKKRNYAKLHKDNPDGYSYTIKTVNEK